MRMLRLTMLVSALLVCQVTARAENAVVLKAYSYEVVRDGYRMPKRRLPIGTIVKVLATHGTRADIATSSGDKVSVRLADLRMLTDPTSSAPITLQQPAVPTPTPPVLSPTPVPSPSPPGEVRTKAGDAGSARPNETDKRSAPVRCSHTTKKGEQCSRMTTSPNGLCWQHGGD